LQSCSISVPHIRSIRSRGIRLARGLHVSLKRFRRAKRDPRFLFLAKRHFEFQSRLNRPSSSTDDRKRRFTRVRPCSSQTVTPMEKLDTFWSSLSISTTFRVRVANDTPLVCASARGERFYTEPCGLGWRFAMLYSSYSQSIMLEYDSHYAHRGLGVMQVTVTLKSEDMPDGECFLREMRPAEPEKRAS
jgi:hypothetical protein